TSNIGNASDFQAAIRSALTSTTVIRISGHLLAIIAQVEPLTYPTPEIGY
ncbi:unnamed protein product, partial [Rotaria magnacalcarata]